MILTLVCHAMVEDWPCVGKPGPGSLMVCILLVGVSTTINQTQTWSQMATTPSTINHKCSHLQTSKCTMCKGELGHFSAHILSFFCAKTKLQQNKASAVDVDAGNQSRTMDTVHIISIQ